MQANRQPAPATTGKNRPTELPLVNAALARVSEIALCLREASMQRDPETPKPYVGSVQLGCDAGGMPTMTLLIECHSPLSDSPSFDVDIDRLRSQFDLYLWRAREIAARRYRERLQAAGNLGGEA